MILWGGHLRHIGFLALERVDIANRKNLVEMHQLVRDYIF
jgi:hypothetical protein